MNAIILDGFPSPSDPSPRVPPGAVEIALKMLAGSLSRRGIGAEVVRLRERDIRPCLGCFHCWTKTPGTCVQRDETEGILRRILAADLMVTLAPVAFGGLAPLAKGFLDRMIPLLLPGFIRVRGEVHHPARYPRLPAWLSLGFLPSPDPEEEDLFGRIFRRNTLNYRGPGSAVRVLSGEGGETARERWRGEVEGLLAEGVGEAPPAPGEPIPPPIPDFLSPPLEGTPSPVKRALLLVGSTRAKSNSAAVGGALLARIAARGWEVTEGRLAKMAEDPSSLAERVRAQGLVILSSPLFSDALPGPVVGSLLRLSQALISRPAPGPPPAWVGISQCGFPESFHNFTPLAVQRRFARFAGLRWAGGVAMGMGEMLGGRFPQGGPWRGRAEALDQAAAALTEGNPIPRGAAELAARSPIPDGFYTLVGNVGACWQAWRAGARIKAAPLAVAR